MQDQSKEMQKQQKMIAEYLSKLTPEQQNEFIEQMSKQNVTQEKSAREKIHEKREMMRFNRLNKSTQQRIKNKLENVMGQKPNEEHNCGHECDHDHSKK